MAKAGSRQARRIANGHGAHDLSRAAMSDEQAAQAQEMAELALGARCRGCGRRIGLGFHFTSVAPRDPTPVIEMAACTRDDCDFAEQAKDGATFCKAVEFAWFDPAGLDARPAAIIVRRHEHAASAGAQVRVEGDGEVAPWRCMECGATYPPDRESDVCECGASLWRRHEFPPAGS